MIDNILLQKDQKKRPVSDQSLSPFQQYNEHNVEETYINLTNEGEHHSAPLTHHYQEDQQSTHHFNFPYTSKRPIIF